MAQRKWQGRAEWLRLRPESTAVNGKTPFNTRVYGIAFVPPNRGVLSDQLEKSQEEMKTEQRHGYIIQTHKRLAGMEKKNNNPFLHVH